MGPKWGAQKLRRETQGPKGQTREGNCKSGSGRERSRGGGGSGGGDGGRLSMRPASGGREVSEREVAGEGFRVG